MEVHFMQTREHYGFRKIELFLMQQLQQKRPSNFRHDRRSDLEKAKFIETTSVCQKCRCKGK